MIIQIYEIQTPMEAESMLDLGVDHIGSVLLEERPQQHSLLKATIETVQSAGHQSSLIPLFNDVESIARAVDFYKPDILHLCDALPVHQDRPDELASIIERQFKLRELFPQVAIMRTIPIGVGRLAQSVPSLELARTFEAISDWLLTDTWLSADSQEAPQGQPVSGYVGITGQTCNWRIARQMVQTCQVPVILAGGIGPSNVQAGIAQVRPAGVDSCTQTNAVDAEGHPVRFRKDSERVQHLVGLAREGARKLRTAEDRRTNLCKN